MLLQESNEVDILMATYNGAAYLENQLLSLIWQTHKNWRLLIHDDGSTDGTLKILEKYAALEPRIRIIRDHHVGLGAPGNFMHLLSFSSSSYIIFCDQDDIWLENKLSRLIELHSQFDKHKPLAVYSNGYAYDPSRGIIGSSITDVFPEKLEDQLFLNAGIQGCSLMFNRALKDKLNQPIHFVAMHDHYITLAAISFGRLVYLNESLMLYRQGHWNKATPNLPDGRMYSSSALFRKHPVIDARHFEATKAFFAAYGEQLGPDQQKLFAAYFQYGDPTSNLIDRVLIVLKHRFNIRKSVTALIVKSILRPAIR